MKLVAKLHIKLIGAISLNADLGKGSVYSVELIEAFPTTISTIELSNELDGLLEVTVQMSYTRWQEIEPSQNFVDLDVDINFGQLV